MAVGDGVDPGLLCGYSPLYSDTPNATSQPSPVRFEAGSPVDVLSNASADLIVIGSRGLRGLRSLGSVSERVANQAGCSV